MLYELSELSCGERNGSSPNNRGGDNGNDGTPLHGKTVGC